MKYKEFLNLKIGDRIYYPNNNNWGIVINKCVDDVALDIIVTVDWHKTGCSTDAFEMFSGEYVIFKTEKEELIFRLKHPKCNDD